MSNLLTLHLSADITSPRDARRQVRNLTDNWPSECVAALQVLVDELVTNVVLHARTDSTLVARVDGWRARVEVSDESTALPQTRHFGVDALTGRGLHLVEALATRWGVQERPGGKMVWFEFECDHGGRPTGGRKS